LTPPFTTLHHFSPLYILFLQKTIVPPSITGKSLTKEKFLQKIFKKIGNSVWKCYNVARKLNPINHKGVLYYDY
jgi:hypothetical protein